MVAPPNPHSFFQDPGCLLNFTFHPCRGPTMISTTPTNLPHSCKLALFLCACRVPVNMRHSCKIATANQEKEDWANQLTVLCIPGGLPSSPQELIAASFFPCPQTSCKLIRFPQTCPPPPLTQCHCRWGAHISGHAAIRFLEGFLGGSLMRVLLRRVLRGRLVRVSVRTGVLRRVLRRGGCHRRRLEGA